MSAVKNVLIVGGGLGALSAAITLRKIGAEVEIVEVQPAYNVYGVGIIQQANALRALDALGVADEAMERGSPYGKVKMCAPTGFQFGEAGTPPIGRFPSHNGISRKILHEILYENAVEKGTKFRMGLTVFEIENNETEAVVTFTDGSTATYDLVIGADGIYSKVRSLIFGEYEPKYIGSSVWRYAFKRPAELDTGSMFFGKKSKVGLIPMTANTIYMFIVAAEGEDNPFIPREEFIPRMKVHLAEYPVKMVADLVDEITDEQGVVYSPLKTLMMPLPWYKNRVAMLGDAVHATIPQLGSGAALAIEDAVVLAEELEQNTSLETALEKYIVRRYNRCKAVMDASNTLAAWEQMEWNGTPLPDGANMGALMGKTLMMLTEPI